MHQIVTILIALAGGVYVLFIPGLVLSFAFLTRDKIDWIERTALSFALSIAVVPLVVFYLNLAGVKLTQLNVILEVLAIIVIAGALAHWRQARADKADDIVLPPSVPRATPQQPSPVRRRPLRRL